MALATTTLNAAVVVNDNSITVVSATSFAAGRLVRIDDEWMRVANSYVSGTSIPVLRGQDGSATAAHQKTANVTHGLYNDFATPVAQTNVTYPKQPAFPIFSYSASGAVSPVQGIHVLNGTSTLTMTLTDPDSSQDGQIMIVCANGKAAHTLTYTNGWGDFSTSGDVATFSASLREGFICIAVNSRWVLIGNGIMSTGTQVGGPTFA